MKKLLAAVSIVALSGASALAADLGARPTYSKAPGVPLSPAYDWSGFYIGANIGGAWTNGRVTDTALNGTPVASGTSKNSGVIGGGQIGYNYMATPNLLFGVEADIDGTSLKGSTTSIDGSNQHTSKLKMFGTARGRAGFVQDNWLFYATGGFAWSEGSITRTQVVAVPGANPPIPAPAGTVETATNTRTGWTAGGEIEWGFAPHWTVRAEYLYLRLGNATSVFPLSNRQETSSVNMNVARLGVNYKF